MLYDLSNPYRREQFARRAEDLLRAQPAPTVELTQRRAQRTLPQNAYLHLLFTWFAIETGYRTEYVKQVIFKQWVNEDLFREEFRHRKTGQTHTQLRSTRTLDTAQMTIAIDRFRHWASAEAGVYLPAPHEQQFLLHIQAEAERYAEYL